MARDPLKGVVQPTKGADKATLRSTAHERGRKSLEHTVAGTFYYAPERDNSYDGEDSESINRREKLLISP